MQRDSNGGHKIPDINPNWPACMCCSDTGIEGGELPPHPHAREYNYCGCPAGKKLRAADADAMVRGLAGLLPQENAKRDKLLKIGAKS